jgi:ribulose-phosphate 3-epimerase
MMGYSVQVSASILSADFSRLGDEIKKCEDAGVDCVHIDVMDGHFVPNISIGLVIVETVRRLTQLPLDTHLMIENPWAYIDAFADAGSDMISIHAECYGARRGAGVAYGHYPKEIDGVDEAALIRDVKQIQRKSKKAFVALNPGTTHCLSHVVGDLDGVLIMSVNPGFSGQQFNAEVLDKIRLLREEFDGIISIDGGINAETGERAVRAGANMLATASYFFGSDDPSAAVKRLKSFYE